MIKYRLRDLCTKIGSGSTPRGGKHAYISSGISLIRSQNVHDLYFLHEGLAHINEAQAQKLNGVIVCSGDILLNITGDSVARACIVDDDILPARVNQHVSIIRVKNTFALSEYVLYFLIMSKEYLLSLAKGGSTRNALTKEMIEELEIELPKIEEQKKICDILYPIDRKIQKNEKINATLQQMAKTAYMHSFFNKKPNGVLGEIIIENSKSSIPVGDAKKSVGDIPFFTSGDAILKWPDSLVDGRNCFLNDGGNAGIKFYVGKAAYSTHTWSITAKDNLADYMYLFLDSITSEVNQKFFQGTGLKNLKKSLLKEREIYIPTKTEIDNFNVKVQSWLTMVSENIQEINTLMNLRDWLLPMLMNGQIKVI